VVPASEAGGAVGVSATILELAEAEGVELLVVGSRGMGGVKSSLMSFMGLGSVGDALLKEAHCPVLLVRQDPAKASAKLTEGGVAEPKTQEGKRVCVPYDGSPASVAALNWAIKHVLQSQDQLHIVCVAASPSQFPVVDETGDQIHEMFAQEVHEDIQHAIARANTSAASTAAAAMAAAEAQGVTKNNLVSSILVNLDVGRALTEYLNANDIHVTVCGSRGMGGWQSAMQSFIGLGSVSTYLAHTVHGLLAVVREPTPTASPDQ